MSEPTLAATAAAAPAEPTTETDTEPDWKAEAEKWKGLARKHEDRAKANADAAAKFDEFRTSQMSEHELAIAAARDEASSTTARTFYSRMAAAEFRGQALAAGVPADVVTEDLEDRDLSKFYDPDTGDIKADRIASAVKRLTPARPPAAVSPAALGQGGRGQASSPSVEQQLADANAKGDWRAVLSLNSQRLAEQARAQK